MCVCARVSLCDKGHLLIILCIENIHTITHTDIFSSVYFYFSFYIYIYYLVRKQLNIVHSRISFVNIKTSSFSSFFLHLIFENADIICINKHIYFVYHCCLFFFLFRYLLFHFLSQTYISVNDSFIFFFVLLV